MIDDSVQPRDRIFAKSPGFLCFPKNLGKNIGKNIRNSLRIVRKLLIILNNLLQIYVKLLQKEQFKKLQRQLVF